MDVTGLQEHAQRLEGIISTQLKDAMENTPDILVKPTYDKAVENKLELFQMVAEAKWAADAKITPMQEKELKSQEGEIGELVGQFEVELNEAPWQNPPALRKLRETTDKLSKKISDLHKQRRNMFPGAKVAKTNLAAIPRDRPMAFAPAAADSKGKSTKPMTVEKCLDALIDRKTNVKYEGGLIGIVHAAGVQEMTPFATHSEAKFEFIFAPKSQAAWTMHQFSAVI